MRGRLLFLAGLATGYLLGSRAGRRAYDRLATKAREVWGDPNLQKVVSQAEQAARDAAALAQAKMSDLIEQAATTAKTERDRASSVLEDTASSARSIATDAAGAVSDAVTDAATTAKGTVKDAFRQSDTD